MSSGTALPLSGIWGTGADDVFAVGYNGTVLHYDGSTWSAMTSGTTEHLYNVWGSGSDDVFVVGGSGTILHYDGSAWSAMSSGTTQSLNGVWGSGTNNVFVVGGSGTILHYDGSAWSAINSGTTQGFNGVWGTEGDDVFAVGYGGAILHYAGPVYGLDVGIVGSGSVSKNPNQVGYHSGDAVTLTATAGSGWFFAGWSGDLVSTTNPLPLTITGSLAATATFSLGTQAIVDPAAGSALVYTDTQGTVTSIAVPGGGVTETVTLAYTPVNTVTLPSGLTFAGLAFDLNAYKGGVLQPSFQFVAPVTVTVAYSDSLVVGQNEEALILTYWDAVASTWRDAAETCTPTSTYIHDLDGNTLSVQICHLSRFALLERGYQIYLPLVIRNH